MLYMLYYRYNISTQDYEAWNGEVTSANNTQMRGTETNLDVYTRFGFNSTEALQVGCTSCISMSIPFLYFSGVTILRTILRCKFSIMQIFV